jgi:hypothetical protein
MRTTEREVEPTSQFKKDRKRELRGRHREFESEEDRRGWMLKLR